MGVEFEHVLACEGSQKKAYDIPLPRHLCDADQKPDDVGLTGAAAAGAFSAAGQFSQRARFYILQS
jgi:hypothetical protein